MIVFYLCSICALIVFYFCLQARALTEPSRSETNRALRGACVAPQFLSSRAEPWCCSTGWATWAQRESQVAGRTSHDDMDPKLASQNHTGFVKPWRRSRWRQGRLFGGRQPRRTTVGKRNIATVLNLHLNSTHPRTPNFNVGKNTSEGAAFPFFCSPAPGGNQRIHSQHWNLGCGVGGIHMQIQNGCNIPFAYSLGFPVLLKITQD